MKQLQLVCVMVAMAAAGRVEAKPAWCPQSTTGIYGDEKSDDPEKLVQAVIRAKCADTPPADVDVNALYNKVSARLGLTDASWSDAVDWASDTTRDVSAKFKLAWTKMGAIQQFGGVKRAQIANGSIDAPYFLDALGTHVTESARAAYIAKCISSDLPVAWAMCQPDIDAFDANKAFAEISADKDSEGWQRMAARVVIAGLPAKLKKHAADVSALLAKDDVYKQMFDISKQERTAWDARYKSGDPSLDVAAAMEDALVTESRKAADGCRKTTWEAVKAVVSKIPAKSFAAHRSEDDKFDEVFDIRIQDTFAFAVVSDESAFPAMNAYMMCAHMQEAPNPTDMLAERIAKAGPRLPGARGPRTSTATKIFLANLKPDDRSAKLDMPRTEREWFSYTASSGDSFGRRAPVSAVRPAGDKVTIEFDKKKHEELVLSGCRSTGRILAFESNGLPRYEEVCASEKMKTFMVGPAPHTVAKDTAGGVKPGTFVMTGDTRVFLVWPNAKAETPSFVLGQPVK